MSRHIQRMINMSGTNGEIDKEASSGFLANSVKRSNRKKLRKVYSCQFWCHFWWTHTGLVSPEALGFSMLAPGLSWRKSQIPPHSFVTQVGSPVTLKHSLEFGNPAHMRLLEIGILELGTLEFNILNTLGYFDILKLDVLVFWSRIILVFWNLVF